jgi:hypothetical protein
MKLLSRVAMGKAWGQFWNPDEEEHLPLETVTGKTELTRKTKCML